MPDHAPCTGALAATGRSAKCAIKAPIAHATRAHVRFIGYLAHFASTLVCASCNNKEEVFLLKYPFKFHLSSYVAQCATFSIFQHSIFQTPNFEHRFLIHLSSVLDMV
ncbi:hypothetical protein HanRHA438_Chr02g0058201 [Helianthus annuus]|nr:hypothetical protein HanRHA438_Chr02g0058201 [Helianthus annuus]